MPNLNPRALFLFFLVTFLSAVIFFLLRKTIEAQTRKEQVMAKTAQRPTRLPFQALDRDTEGFVLQLLAQLKSHMGIIVLTHRLRTARAADRVYVIEAGRIGAVGDHQDLLLSNNLYSRAWYDLVGGESVGI